MAAGSLAELFGKEGLQALAALQEAAAAQTGAAAARGDGEGGEGDGAEGGGAAAEEEGGPVVEKVLGLIAALQARLQESEESIIGLQAEADGLEEKRRAMTRQAERAERDRDSAVEQCKEAEALAKQAKAEAAPVVARYMEAEVLRSQVEAATDEVQRLRQEIADCQEELKSGRPRLATLEAAEAECREEISELEVASAKEVAALTAQHLEEVAKVRSEHATRLAEIEATSTEELTALKLSNTGEISRLRTALEGARWQAEVHLREQQDAIREITIRQRENARIAKRHSEARQEALELAVKLEALRASEGGASAREAELHAVRQRYNLLMRTRDEWREALQRKRADCEAWRRRAVERSGTTVGAEADGDFDDFDSTRSPPLTNTALGVSAGSWASEVFEEGADVLGSGGRQPPAAALQAAPEAPPALRPSRSAAAVGRRSSGQRRLLAATPSRGGSAPRPSAGPPRGPAAPAASRGGGGGKGPRGGASAKKALPPFDPGFALGGVPEPAQHPAEEFFVATLRMVQMEAEAETAWSRQQQVELARAVEEAQNELEMLAFLLSDADVQEAEALLELEARRQRPPVAQRLQARCAALSARARHQSSHGGS